MPRHVALHSLAVVSLLASACGKPSARPDSISASAPSQAPQLSGVWDQHLPNAESYRLRLFPSGIVGFQHVGEKLPISLSYGRWTYSAGQLELTIVDSEPDSATFPLATRFAATVSADKTLVLQANGQTSTWTAVEAPYGTTPGVAERAARDERDWTSRVTRGGQSSAAD